MSQHTFLFLDMDRGVCGVDTDGLCHEPPVRSAESPVKSSFLRVNMNSTGTCSQFTVEVTVEEES